MKTQRHLLLAGPGNAPVDDDGKLSPLKQAERVFDHGHDVCVLDDGDLIVCSGNVFKLTPSNWRKSLCDMPRHVSH